MNGCELCRGRGVREDAFKVFFRGRWEDGFKGVMSLCLVCLRVCKM